MPRGSLVFSFATSNKNLPSSLNACTLPLCDTHTVLLNGLTAMPTTANGNRRPSPISKSNFGLAPSLATPQIKYEAHTPTKSNENPGSESASAEPIALHNSASEKQHGSEQTRIDERILVECSLQQPFPLFFARFDHQKCKILKLQISVYDKQSQRNTILNSFS